MWYLHFLWPFLRNICLLWSFLAFKLINFFCDIVVWDEIETESKVTKIFHSLNTCIYTRVVFAFFKSHFHFTQIILYKYCSLIFCKYSLIFNSIDKLCLRKEVWHFVRTFSYLKQSLHQDLQNVLFLFGFFQEINTKSMNSNIYFRFCYLFRSLQYLIIVLCKIFVMKFYWFYLRYFIFIGTFLFKISIKMLRKCHVSIFRCQVPI